jgi:branched-chain amino acid transport system substrate-binding protein
VFRVVPSDTKQGAFAGAYIAARFAGKKVVDDNSHYGTYLTESARSALDAAGKPPALTESYVPGQKDFSTLVSQLKAAGIEIVYAGGYHDDIGRLVREMRKQGEAAQLIAGDALVTTEYWRIARRASEGTLMSFIADPRKNAAAARIVKKFRAARIEPDGYTLHNYVAVKLWADAAKAAGSAKFEGVIGELNKVSADTVIGKVRFDRNGDLVEPQLIWYVWHGGKYGPLKSTTSGN